MSEISLSIKNNNLTLKQKLCRKVVLYYMSNIKDGCITLHDCFGVIRIGNKASYLHASIKVHDLDFYISVFSQASIGFGNSYINGYLEVDSLTNLLRIFAMNLSAIKKAEGHAVSRMFTIYQTILYLFQHNTPAHSKKNILYHYDLSNEFFKIFLDKSMSYSGLVFDSQTDTLEQAAINKNLLLLKILELKAEDHLLEIGTGWGGLAIMAALEIGCKVDTTTISNQQFEYARDEIHRLNLQQQINLLNLDYRKINGKYTKIVSIEMIEAVGYQYYDEYFKICSDLLEQNGLFCLQTIVIRDQEYERAKKEVDFIKKYIFPGGCLPSLNSILKSISKVTDLSVLSVKDITYDYAVTLRLWRKRMMSNMQNIYQLGFDENFLRTWEYYFSYCEAGFLQRNIMNLQIVFSKPSYVDKRYNAQNN